MNELKLLKAAATNLVELIENFEAEVALAEQGTFKEDILQVNNQMGTAIAEIRGEYINLAGSPTWLAINQMIRNTGGN
jgi:hypothetical protein